MLTKKQLMEALAAFPDDAPVMVWAPPMLTEIVDVCANGRCVQLQTTEAQAALDPAAAESVLEGEVVR